MYPNPYVLWLLANERHSEDLKNAALERMLLANKSQNRTRHHLWDRFAWQVGAWLIQLGQRLQHYHKAPACALPTWQAQ